MLTLERVDDIAVVRVADDVDIASAPELAALLRGASDEPVVVVDVSRCAYFDSTGFTVLYKTIGKLHIVLHLPEASRVRRLLEIMLAAMVFPIFTSEVSSFEAARAIAASGRALPTRP